MHSKFKANLGYVTRLKTKHPTKRGSTYTCKLVCLTPVQLAIYRNRRPLIFHLNYSMGTEMNRQREVLKEPGKDWGEMEDSLLLLQLGTVIANAGYTSAVVSSLQFYYYLRLCSSGTFVPWFAENGYTHFFVAHSPPPIPPSFLDPCPTIQPF